MIAITGASGFIGSYLTATLDHPQKRLSRKKIEEPGWLTGDLSNKADVAAFVKNSPVLIHLACTTHPRTSNLNIQQDLYSNLISTVNLLESYAELNPDGHIIFSSTGGNMYYPSPNALLHCESELPCPQSSYGIHKLTAENYLRLICDMYGIKGTILRISNPYGLLLPKERVQGLIGVAFAKIIANEKLQIFDSMDSVRDYIHLSDVTAAFKLVIDNPPKKNVCRLYNVGSGQSHTLKEVISFIESVTRTPLTKYFSSTPLPPPTYSVLSYKKISDELGWKPTINLRDGLEGMWQNIQKLQLAHHL